MRLITHNMLKCNVRGVEDGYPLRVEPEKIDVIECECNKGERKMHCTLPVVCPRLL